MPADLVLWQGTSGQVSTTTSWQRPPDALSGARTRSAAPDLPCAPCLSRRPAGLAEPFQHKLTLLQNCSMWFPVLDVLPCCSFDSVGMASERSGCHRLVGSLTPCPRIGRRHGAGSTR